MKQIINYFLGMLFVAGAVLSSTLLGYVLAEVIVYLLPSQRTEDISVIHYLITMISMMAGFISSLVFLGESRLFRKSQ